MKRFDRLTLSAVAVLLTGVLGVTYMVVGVLGVPLTSRPDRVTVRMNSTGGLFEGSPVTYRGSRVGSVSRIEIAASGPVAEITFEDDAQVPKASTARVSSLSPVGEQYLDLRPEKDAGPYLDDGDVIEATAVELPVSVASAAGNLDMLLQNVDDKDIRILLRELNLGVSGSGDDLETLLESSNQLVTSLDQAWPETAALLRDGRTVNQVLDAHRGDLTRFSEAARQLTAFLRGFDPTFRTILAESPEDLDQIGALIRDLGPLLPPLLANLTTTMDLLHDREHHLRRLSTAMPTGFRSFAGVFRDGWMHMNLIVDGHQRCTYDNPPRDPQSTDRRPLYTQGHCTGSRPWRGAQHAPPPVDR